MFNRRIGIAVAVVLALGGTVAIAKSNSFSNQAQASYSQEIAQQQPPSEREGRPQRGERGDRQNWMDKLNLTQEQRTKIEAIHAKYKDQIDQNQQAMRQGQEEMRELMMGDASADTIRQKHQALEPIMQKTGQLRFESMLEIREVLTLEQRRQFGEKMGHPPGKRMGDRGPERGEMPGPPL
jgi:Spy/CpxP family protein refolding chaperone